jgi:hypothetical protein
VGGQETCPLPDDPTLASIAKALNDAGYWAIIGDRNWRNLYITEAQRLSEGGLLALAPFPIGVHISSPESLTALLAGRGRLNTIEASEQGSKCSAPTSSPPPAAERNFANSSIRGSTTLEISFHQPSWQTRSRSGRLDLAPACPWRFRSG